MHWLVWWIVGFTVLPLGAQPTPEIPVTAGRVDVMASGQWFEDIDGRLSLDEVRSLDVAETFSLNPEGPGRIVPGTRLWVRMSVDPEFLSRRWLAIRIGIWSEICAHWPVSGSSPADRHRAYRSDCTGVAGSFMERPIRHKGFVFPPPQEFEAHGPVFLSVRSLYPEALEAEWVDHRTFFEQERDTQLSSGLYYGVLLAMVLYNLCLFASLHDRTYLFLSLHIGGLGLAFFGFDGFATQYFWPQRAELWPTSLGFLGLAFLGGPLFVRRFLLLQEHAPRLDRILMTAVPLAGLGTALVFFQYFLANLLIGIASMIFALTSMAAAIVRWRQGYRPARYLLIAMAAFLMMLPLSVLSALTVLPWYPSQRTILHLSVAASSLLLSFGLADRVREINAERQRLIPELEARHHELARFNYTLSHDLKNPLVTIQGFLGWVERDATSGNMERLRLDLERIRSAVGRMQQLLEGLLEFSRYEYQKDVVKVDVGLVMRDARDVLADTVEHYSAQVEIASDLPEVTCNRAQLQRVVEILLDNALRFGQEPEGPRVEMGARREGDTVLCWVRDEGIGIDPPYQERIFDLFEKLEGPQSGTGTGVGLTLARRIIQAQGGRLWVESEGLGKGSTFWWTLPRTSPLTIHGQESHEGS